MTWLESRITELGLSSTGCDPYDRIARHKKLPEIEPTRELRDIGLMKSRYVYYSCAASLYFLVQGDHSNARKWADAAVDDAEKYFFGEWRDLVPTGNAGDQPPSREYQDINAPWWDYFQEPVCLATALGRWADFERFTKYLRDDVRLNIDQPESNRAWWLYFCGRVRQRPANEIAQFHETVVEAKRAKADQLLLTWVDDLFDGTDDELQAAVTKYFQHHRKVEWKKPGLGLAYRASMLLHYGAHLGREVDRPANSDLYVVEFAD